MSELRARAAAGLLNGEPWQTGGGEWVVKIMRTNGSFVVVSADAICEYDDMDCWYIGTPTVEVELC